MNQAPPHTILLDLDGTLTDPFPGISACIRHALEAMDLAVPSQSELRTWIGPPLLDSFRSWFSACGVRADAGQALALYRERFSEKGLFENRVYEGIIETLARLRHSGHGLVLATAKPRVFAARIVAHFGLDDYLGACHGSELDGTRTDKVELLEYIVAQERLDPGSCAMVGDRHHDMHAARYHGMRAVGVTWGYGTQAELLEAGAEQLIHAPAELGDLFG